MAEMFFFQERNKKKTKLKYEQFQDHCVLGKEIKLLVLKISM